MNNTTLGAVIVVLAILGFAAFAAIRFNLQPGSATSLGSPSSTNTPGSTTVSLQASLQATTAAANTTLGGSPPSMTTTTMSSTTTSTTTASTSSTITIRDHRVDATYWAPCFATACANPTAACNTGCTGPGASMYVALYDSTGQTVASGFADEDGLTFNGLTAGATYYIYPSDCNLCHGSTHDVLFDHWGTGGNTRSLPVVASGNSVDAWYICTNGCTGY